MQKIVLLSLLTCSLALSANEMTASQDSNNGCETPKPVCPPPPPKPVCPPKPPKCCPPPKPVCTNPLCSAVPNSENGWYIFGDLLYWHADVDHADWAFKNNNTAATVIAGPNHSLDFKWSYGFRVGIGANMDYDKWDTNLYYTWFQTKNSNSVGTKGPQQAADLFGISTPFTQGEIDWRIHYSVIDWELGKWYYVSKHLSMRPHIGIKNAWISQHVRESFTMANSSSVARTSNEFWGIGASGGLNTTWNFATVNTHRFNFFGDFAGALMYGHFEVKHKEANFHPTNLSRNLLAPMLSGIFGMSWDTSFNCERNHFTWRIGYEFQYWFRQNQMLINENNFTGEATQTLVTYLRSAGSLGLQGLTVDFRFDF